VQIQVAPSKPGPMPAADGYLAAAYATGIVSRLRQTGAPVISLDGTIDAPFPRAGTDPDGVAGLAAAHLLALRPRSVAFVGQRDRHDSRLLRAAFLGRMAAAGMPVQTFDMPGWWRSAEETAHEQLLNDRRIRAWLRELPVPCALLTWSESMAAHIVDISHGTMRLGHDLWLLSGGDDPDFLAGWDISGITRDVDMIAGTAVAALDVAMRTGERPRGHLLVPPLGIVERASTRPPLARDPAIARALEALRGRTGSADVGRLAQAAGLPERTFRRRFRHAVGRSPVQEAVRVRLARARALLAAGRPLAEVAEQCGYRRGDSLRRALNRQR
jgi:LacI family transcriptional regulator